MSSSSGDGSVLAPSSSVQQTVQESTSSVLENDAYSNYNLVSCLVENKPGVLHKISNMFRSRGFNIDSISVGPTDDRTLARMTIRVMADGSTMQQVLKQLRKLIDIIDVDLLDPKNTVSRELALVQVAPDSSDKRQEVMNYVSAFRGKVVDISPKTITLEITGSPGKVESFIDLLEPFQIKKIARTGVAALPRGERG
jgi:acetolactate synthase-1/3 small subunit